MINFSKSGSWGDLKNSLNRIYEENYTNNSISKAMEKMLYYDMQATLLKVLEETNISIDLIDMDYSFTNKQPPEKFFKWIEESYQKICSTILSNKKSHNSELKDRILEYIDANYTDGNLSVSMVASCFNLSESYFSQFFKEQTGITFTSYVENLRIKLACKLISQNSLSIDEIAKTSGYNIHIPSEELLKKSWVLSHRLIAALVSPEKLQCCIRSPAHTGDVL